MVSRGLLQISAMMIASWDMFDIEIVPTIVLFKDGKPVFRKDGVCGQGFRRALLGKL